LIELLFVSESMLINAAAYRLLTSALALASASALALASASEVGVGQYNHAYASDPSLADVASLAKQCVFLCFAQVALLRMPFGSKRRREECQASN
jgi:hypothetical protein